MPFWPINVTLSPFGELVNVVPRFVLTSMLAHWPFWNSTVSRSYPACVPVLIALMYPVDGEAGAFGTKDVPELHVNAGRVESGVGEALELARGVDDEIGVGLDPTPGAWTLDGRLSGLAMKSTPTTTAAITAAATPAIQNGPLCSGASASEDRTRSDSAALGVPAMSSKT
jgi:hypothetical protein